MKLLHCVLLLLSVSIANIAAAKILAIFPFPGPSQYILVQPYLKELAARGHELTVVNAYPQSQPIKNWRDISVSNVLKIQEDLIAGILVKQNIWDEFSYLSQYGNYVTQKVLENPEVKELMQQKQYFDLLIVETLFNEALYGLAEHLGAHLIGLSSFGTATHLDGLVGNPSPPSYIPNVMLTFTDQMTFLQRLKNLAFNSVELIHRHVHQFALQDKIYRKYFPHAKHSMLDARKNFSLMLLNQHFSLSFPRPYVPNMIEVGGLHISHQPAALPDAMERFINGSGEAGVIYFSMGSNIKSKDLPPEKLAIFMRTFASLKQRVLWKFESTDLPGKPDNVFISKWFPQPDVLAHPKVKLFITHGGLLSTIEAIYHGKPVLGIPMFYDQPLNVQRAENAGFGLGVDFQMLSVENFGAKIQKLLTDGKYSQIAQRMSKRYRDQPMTPLQTAIYWTEYVLRHDGAGHMRCAAQDLNFMQEHSLDTAAVLFGGSTVVLLMVSWLVIKLISRFLRKEPTKKIKKH